MTMTAADLPDYTTAPPGAQPSALTAGLRRAEVGRRSLLKLASGGALGVGLAALDLVGRALPARATNPNPVLSVWDTCQGYFNASSICVPASAWYSGVCNGSWHRNDSYSGSTVTYNYTFDNTSCNGRNAWRWTSGTRRKCSDGHTYYQDGTNYRNTFSICRTAI